MARSADPYTVSPQRRPQAHQEPHSGRSGWLTVREAAEVLDVSETTVRKRVSTNELSARRNADDVLEVFVQVQA